MLGILRSAAGTWVAKLLLSLLVVSFAVWGVSGRLMGGLAGHDSVITAGGTKVSINEYRLAYDRQLAVMSQQFGQRLTHEQAKALGVDNQVLAQLVSGAVLDEQARKLGLGLSKDRLAELTREDPAFKGPGGQFDRRAFEYRLREVGMRPEDYLKNRAQVAVRQQIVEAVSDGLKAPDTFFKAVALYRGEDRTVDYLTLPKALVEPIEAPSDSALQAYFEANKKTYAAPEYRKFSYVRLEPQDIMDTSSVTDAQVSDDYNKNKARYTTPEMRTIEQLVFKTPDEAKAALDSLKSGATFDKLVTAEGKTPADTLLGTLAKDKIADKAVADAAFALNVNEVSPVVQGAFGPVLLRVTEIKPEVVKPLAEVSDQIRKDLALGEANRILLDVHDNYEDSRAAGSSLADAAAKLKLKVVTVDAIDRSGLRPDGSIVKDLPESPALIKAAFDAEPNTENEALTTADNGFIFYEVASITPARDRTLDEVRQKVVADWTAAETAKRLTAKAQELEKRLKAGATLDVIAGELKLEKQTKRGLKREADDADFGKEGAAVMFGVGEGGTGLIPSPTSDAQILFKVAEVFEPAGADASSVPEDARKSFTSGMSDDLLDQLVAQLQTQYGVRVDQAAVAQASTR
ncbi:MULTISPECIES: SurA N-terminal domain-containing protein [unclassified Mesorhizobium]|uniref:SurA N-terminal domain-containing protein n=1 Tax=unclassified Mesorhizobium TaxID=325217 RepID=UPI00112DB675|nr:MULTISPECIES: SurA N-terminal domain-containing protein [unclassified Mesorhizobium]TPJ46369.1 peptidylprolyl isomerase [Mesorhizobium sp. B2-6-6]MBZ9700803.1 SurA N-terminal domain-containing protein [Mesorhizobium sp. CO1-1-3]MBZ9896558.1 SurA N-terminal domain-containing protein [Mesorhizobium sp. BR1-1-6]MBZ9946739.1 SurA N-terminal domain-containing protein [Mesorhizobium sp. BR1-1-11]MBZ9981242.1 SurA N-terminal domain-containing protein [Mesorhizobium sp. BR-1-1-8]